MRKHQFRAWIDSKKKYADGVSVYSDGSWDAEFVTKIGIIGGYGEEKNDCLEMFSGYRDLNGVKIYEGDILKLDDDWLAPVVYEKSAFWVDITGNHRVKNLVPLHTYIDNGVLDKLFVAGTIHDKELKG